MELDQDAEKFWEEGSYKTSQTFGEQLAELEAHPGSRQNIIKANAISIIGTGDIKAKRSKTEFSEAEGLLDLKGFLDKAQAVAAEDHTPEGRREAKAVANFMEKFSFLGDEEYQEACQGMAGLWASYVGQGKDYILNIAIPRKGKSPAKVLEDVMSSYAKLTEGTDLAGRVVTNPEAWLHTEQSKLLVVDDWSVSGNSIEVAARNAMAMAEQVGKPELAEQLEAHVLISVAGQSSEKFVANGREFKLRSYFETPNAGRVYEVRPSGAHSSVDYGFEEKLDDFRLYLEGQGVKLELPLLCNIARTYSSDTNRSPAAQEILQKLAQLNGRETELRRAEAAYFSAFSTRKPWEPPIENTTDFMSEIGAVMVEQQALRDRYYQLEA